MYTVNAYRDNHRDLSAKIRQLPPKRDWMHSVTYNCTPIMAANSLGYGIYFDQDISFVWDGDRKNPATAILGSEHIWSGRGEGTVSFNTNLILRTDPDVSILTMPVPNQFIEGAEVITTVLSSSIFTGSFPIVWKLHEANKEYFVKAGTDVACILPVSIAQFQDSNINVLNEVYPSDKRIQDTQDYLDEIQRAVSADKPRLKMYKKAIDHKGNKIGKHEVDNLKMNVTEFEGNLK
jgi:hypothetical protein